MTPRTEPNTALVTGGDTGIGKAIADALTGAGFTVRTASRRSGVDLVDGEAIERLAASLERLDLLVNNAGIAESAPVHRTDDELWDRHLALNVTAPFRLVRACLPLLRKSAAPHIVNVGSVAGLRGAPYIAAYAASKHALMGLHRCLAAELDGVRVNAVCPGFVDSPLTDRSVEKIAALTGGDAAEARRQLAAQNPSGRLVTPAEVAAAVLELVQGDAHGAEIILE